MDEDTFGTWDTTSDVTGVVGWDALHKSFLMLISLYIVFWRRYMAYASINGRVNQYDPQNVDVLKGPSGKSTQSSAGIYSSRPREATTMNLFCVCPKDVN